MRLGGCLKDICLTNITAKITLAVTKNSKNEIKVNFFQAAKPLRRTTVAATGIVRDDFYKRHAMGSYHPECPERLDAIYTMLDERQMHDRFTFIQSREATREEIAAIHTAGYYQLVAQTAHRNGLTPLDPDTSACPDTFQAAKLAAGGLLSLVEAVHLGKVNNGFAFVRPPGHHAESNRAMGFCIFNNIAIAAAKLLNHYNLKKILIVDWDLHHGNATQHSFYDSSQVLYFSTHQYPYYPGTGSFEEVGEGPGKGYTVNVPLAPGAGDNEFMMIFRQILQPLAREFCPDFVLLSAGFDTYFQDPLGGMRVTPRGYAGLTQVALEIAEELCQGKLALTLEGGYSLEGLRDSVREVLTELHQGFRPQPAAQENPATMASVITRVKKVHQQFWQCFA